MSAQRRAARTARLDELLVARGLADTLARSQALVLAGRVRWGGVILDKAGARVPDDAPIELTPARRYVGRGAHKLAGALADLAVEARERLCLDVGASTGGFTQVLLEAGASAVAALDVGRGLLDASLRSDPRVVLLEGINARHLRPEQLPFRPTLAVVDVSFISLAKVLPPLLGCLAPGGEAIVLVKPQFEVARADVGRGGIVRDPALHRDVLLRLTTGPAARGWSVRALARSRIDGAEGNAEFFLALRPEPVEGLSPVELAQRIDALTHPELPT